MSATIPAWARPLGVALVLAGALLTFWCIGTFAFRGRGTPAPFDPPREFVAAGPYRYVRNPMYIGGFGVLLGAGLWSFGRRRSPGWPSCSSCSPILRGYAHFCLAVGLRLPWGLVLVKLLWELVKLLVSIPRQSRGL